MITVVSLTKRGIPGIPEFIELALEPNITKHRLVLFEGDIHFGKHVHEVSSR